MSDYCGFTHVDTRGAFYTWTRGLLSTVEMRLDRSLINSHWIDAWNNSYCITLPQVNSNHHPLLLVATHNSFSGPRPFRFIDAWTYHSSFMKIVSDCWKSTIAYGCPMFILREKLKRLKLCLKAWNKEVFGHIDNRVQDDQNALAAVQDQIERVGPQHSLLQQEATCKQALLESLRIQERFWKDKSRMRWLSEGDRNSAYFHKVTKIRAVQGKIHVLKGDQGLISDPIHIKQHIVDYYTTLYSASSPTLHSDLVDSIIPQMVTEEENILLTSVPSAEEIRAAIFSMDPHSSPGPDGFNGFFFQTCWEIVSSDVIKAVTIFFEKGFFIPNFNSSFMVLIPKVPNADSLGQFRPIVMANFIFKIIPKILADRLAPIAHWIISPNQTAFIKGRKITENIGLASECLNLLDHKSYGGNVGLKLDIAKTFDTLSWSFLLQVLSKFGFNDKFTAWISSILHSAKISILINGSPFGHFGCSRGVRQGDPLSPLLFCLAEEVLSRGIT
ncbi:hypothetical protein L1049_017564 [Liquidambar formosana]|uniref:Reverse transcriptase domain-containing protein n=1 Tax=Liquidambar formosana TaxID=63359 RepID=A0AAP0S4H6_LIQFO